MSVMKSTELTGTSTTSKPTKRLAAYSAACIALLAPVATASVTWTNSPTGNGPIGSNSVYGVYESGGTIYAGTNGGGLAR